ncbi:PIN domain-containing protein [Candidatus Micrarchaeota archaeon]|nr:PIN domain-containing protein [Candidatus Micrarchaeota archaeon]
MAYLLDSFAWLEYFGQNSDFVAFIDHASVPPYTVSTSIAEIIRSLYRKNFKPEEIARAVRFIQDKSVVLDVDAAHATAAGHLAHKTGLHFADALIYAFVDKDHVIVTGDPHFKSLDFVHFIP